MSGDTSREILEEAASIFLLLRDYPDDPELRARKDAFLNLGQRQRDAFEKVVNGWQVTGVPPRPAHQGKKLASIVLALALTGAAYLSADQLRTLLIADIQTGPDVLRTQLASGDVVDVDAGSALADLTGETARGAELLHGAAYFDVTRDETPFVVKVDDLEVRVLGTAFEVSQLGPDTVVAVFEGQVSVRHGPDSWLLTPGDRLVWSADSGAAVDHEISDEIASWRHDRLVTDGMSFAQAIEVVDRRLPGTVMILNDDIAETQIVGAFDLSNPASALKTLAAIQDLRVISASPLLTILSRR